MHPPTHTHTHTHTLRVSICITKHTSTHQLQTPPRSLPTSKLRPLSHMLARLEVTVKHFSQLISIFKPEHTIHKHSIQSTFFISVNHLLTIITFT